MAWWPSLADQSVSAARLLAGLSAFLRRPPLSMAECRSRLRAAHATRDSRFLELARRGIFENPGSPYRPLLEQAGIAHGDLVRLVAVHGLEGALARLCEAGVRVTLDEFKGRRPMVVAGRELTMSREAFDNPLLTRHYETRSSGSRGPATRTIVDLDLIEHEACYDAVCFDDFGLTDRPKALWRMLPPGASGVKEVLRLARLGGQYDAWFSQMPASLAKDPGHAVFTLLVVLVGRSHGRRLPWPQYVPVDEAVTVARWLAECRTSRGPAYLSTTPSCAVRVCAAALEHGLDVHGTFIRAGGEPLSSGKVKVITAAGCTVRPQFGMAEVGKLGVACSSPVAADDMHLMSDKLAIVQRPATRAPVDGLWLTTLHWSVPKIMLNVEIGDTAVFGRRACGCAWDRLGFTDHLHTILSYDKLTTEGMHFMGADLLALVEDVLPTRFGGTATDYQFVEVERKGVASVQLVVSPRVGALDEGAASTTVLDYLASRDRGHRLMAGVWQQSGTIHVVRREPETSGTGKIQALQQPRPGGVR